MSTVGDLGEFALLQRLRPVLASDGGAMVVGAGDDAAVWQPPLGQAIVVTTDSLAEGAHFTVPLDAPGAADLGWRLLAVSLSDLAAMGARPGPAFISLALPPSWPVAWVEAMYQGLAECAARFDVDLAGGNITAAPAAVLTSTCVGSVDSQELLRRDGAEAGWQLAATGSVGAAAARIRAAAEGQDPDPAWEQAARPIPRLTAGQVLVEAGVRVAMDISDGLYLDAGRLMGEADAEGLLIDAAAIPVAPGIRERWPADWTAVVGGGEDYELLFAAEPIDMDRALRSLADAEVPAVVIGVFDDRAGLRVLVGEEEVPPPAPGHQHFAA